MRKIVDIDAMVGIADLLKRYVRAILVGGSQEGSKKGCSAKRKWRAITVSDREMEEGSYKRHLGGGATQWDLRGRFQLFFLKKMGLLPSSRLLDVGCGPIRAGVHFISYLDAGNYYGVDFNRDFIRTAHQVVGKENLVAKNPQLEVLDDFNFKEMNATFDYAIVFSVLNHCDEHQRRRFFQAISNPVKKEGKIYISHASWFSEPYLANTEITKTNQFNHQDLNVTERGWPEPGNESPFPIIELVHR